MIYYSNLFNLIRNCKSGDKESIEKLCEKFNPLIKRYSYLLHNEDAYNNLILGLILCVKKIPLNKSNFYEDKYILSYIKSSIINSYIQLNIKKERYEYTICLYSDEKTLNIQTDTKENFIDEFLLMYDLKKLLNEKEFLLFKLKFVNEYSDKRISEILSISRQAVNKQVHKLQDKLKPYIQNNKY